MNTSAQPLRCLLVEDSDDDARLMLRQLRDGGFDVTWERVETADAMLAALAHQPWDLILSDYLMPRFSGLAALELLRTSGLDLPFIVVSGTVGEDVAVGAMKAGAHDYLMKDRLTRLAPAVTRELAEAAERRARRRAEEALRASLQEKEALLKEVHHRVKNNLQVMTSLFRLEASRTGEPGARRVLRDMQGRILSMALLHETLYRSGIFERVDLANYLQQLASQLFRAHNDSSARAALALDLSPVQADIDQAIPCGLIVNELLANSLKHAFVEGQAGEVKLTLRQEAKGEVRLQVTDTGAGLPGDFEARRSRSLGLQLVSDLARQLGGRLEIGRGPGAGFTVFFTAAARTTTAQIPRPQEGK